MQVQALLFLPGALLGGLGGRSAASCSLTSFAEQGSRAPGPSGGSGEVLQPRSLGQGRAPRSQLLSSGELLWWEDAAFHSCLLGGPPSTGACTFLPGADVFPRSPASRRHCNPRLPTLGSSSPLCSSVAAARTAGFRGCSLNASCKPAPTLRRACGRQDRGLS